MAIGTPALFLSFDDWYISEWHGILPLLHVHNVKATFYLAFGHGTWHYDVTPELWGKLREMGDRGHTIGYHGFNHLWADNALRQKTCQDYFTQEIEPGLDFMAQHGFHPRHWAYPYDSREAATHACLLGRFDTLRATVTQSRDVMLYDAVDLADNRVYLAYDYKEPDFLQLPMRLVRENKVGFMYGHNPQHYYRNLKTLLEFCGRNNIKCYPMSALDR